MFHRSIQKWYGTYTSGSGTCHRDKTEFVFFFLLIDLIIFFLSRSASVESTLTKKTYFLIFLNFHLTCVFRCKPFRMHRYGWFCLVCGFYCPGRRPNLKEITVINHQGALDRFQFRTIPGHVNINLWYLFSLRKRLICHYR